MFFTIIIPVYNAELYLNYTIESIINQSFENFEIILINDGSSDKSPEICKYWSKADERIKYIDKKNEGVSKTRNLGIQIANGKYLVFVDADDFLQEEALITLYEIIENYNQKPDILLANHARFNSKTKTISEVRCNYDQYFIENSNSDKLLKYLFDGSLRNFKCSIWSHVYRTDFVKNNKILFDKRLVLSEDIDWTFNILTKAKHFGSTKKIIYLYREDNQDSTTHEDYNYNKYKSNNLFQIKWIDFFNSSKCFKYSKHYMLRYLSRIYISYAVYIYNIPIKKERSNAVSLFYNNLHFIKDPKYLTYRFIMLLKFICGNHLFLHVINRIYKLKLRMRRVFLI